MRRRKLFSFLVLPVALLFLQSCNEKKDTPDSSVVAGHPDWSAQSNIYEINLRQFTNEGTIMAFEKALPRLKDMGVEVLWFMPVTPIGVEGRKNSETDLGSYYAVKDYKAFNPEYGTMDDWKAFVTRAHEMGFKVIVDWVANHSAPDNPWITKHPDFYAKDSTGDFVAPYDWTDVRKLDYTNPQLRDSMIDAMKFWVIETGVDGFRCDVADDVPIDFWKRCIAELKKHKHVFMLAEGGNLALFEAGFDELYAWSIMHAMTDLYAGKKNLRQFDSLINAEIAQYPPNAYRLFFTTNHDENSWNGTEFEKYGAGYLAFSVFSQTMYQSVPLIYNGQEDKNKKRLKFFVKDTIPWEGEMDLAPFYKTLLHLRRANPALAADAAYKKISSTADDAIFAYQREKVGKKVLVVLNFSDKPQTFALTDEAVSGNPLNVFSRLHEKITPGQELTLAPWDYRLYTYQ